MASSPNIKPDTGDMIMSQANISGRCTTTGEYVIAVEQKQFTIARGRVVWWRCPACKGWHAKTFDKQEQSKSR